jgi:hypothetical protein
MDEIFLKERHFDDRAGIPEAYCSDMLQHGVVQRVTEKMAQEASDELRRHATHVYLQRDMSGDCLLEGMTPFLAEVSERLIWFDAEMDATTYSELMQSFAGATGGEWSRGGVANDIMVDDETGGYRITLEFEVHGEQIHREWITLSPGWVDNDFLELINRMSNPHLDGEFLNIPMHDQTMLFAYLPHPVAHNLHMLIDRLEHEYSDFVTFARKL